MSQGSTRNYFSLRSRPIIPSLTIKKVKAPKLGANKPIFNPPAKIAGFIFSLKDSMASKAVMRPIISPKKPQTNANSPSDFSISKVLPFGFGFKYSFTISAIEIIRSIKIVYINNGPPSFNKFILYVLKLFVSKVK